MQFFIAVAIQLFNRADTEMLGSATLIAPIQNNHSLDIANNLVVFLSFSTNSL